MYNALFNLLLLYDTIDFSYYIIAFPRCLPLIFCIITLYYDCRFIYYFCIEAEVILVYLRNSIA